MGETFVAVDLDKLLDDFEEQDSVASAEHSQQLSSTLNGINSKVIESNGLLTTSMHSHSASKINHKDIGNNVADPPNATLGADGGNVVADLLPTCIKDQSNEEKNYNKNKDKSIDHKVDANLGLNDDHDGKTCDSISNDHLCEGLSNEQQKTTSKDNIEEKQESHVESVPLPNVLIDRDSEPVIKKDETGNNKEGGGTDILEQGETSTVTADCREADPAENNQMSDLILLDIEDANGEGRTLNEESTSNVPSARPDDISSLFFMQDYFANIDLREQTMDNSNSSVFEAELGSNPLSSNEAVGNNEQPDGSHHPESQLIPVAQDAIAEVSLPARNNCETMTSEEFIQLGYSPPQWVPDSAVNRCVGCHCKFTMVKRRHHCRACGQIFCSSCCNLKFNLQYLEDKLARVCQACANTLLQRQATLASRDASVSSNGDSAMYISLSPEQHENADPQPVQPITANADTITQDDNRLDFESGHIQDLTTGYDTRSLPAQLPAQLPALPESNVAVTDDSSSQIPHCVATRGSSSSSISSADIPVTSTVPLPPLLRKTNEGLKVDNAPNHQDILYRLKKRKETVTFLLNKNLIVKVKIVKLSCCVKRKCWCFSSEGMGAADQEDMVILLECVPKESSIPQDVLSHFNTSFAYAKQGHRVTDLGYTIFGQPFLGSLRNAGFLYIKSSFQCLENLILPPGPHIFGILIQREEVSWVQLFPIRLILRLGAEYKYYPCPLWSVRGRAPLYVEVGHTIMDLLADFKNFQYTLPRVTGMHVHLEDKRTVIQLPQTRYDEVVKVLNATDEYVMAFEANFSNVADSHLVCIQDGGGYKTQAINIEGQERKVTGASFIVFNGALKTTTDLKAKVSIVEDGVMIQMVMQLSQEMRQAMREMRDFSIQTGIQGNDAGSVQEVVLEWITKRTENESVFSPIDGLRLGTTSDIKINTHFDFSTPTVYRLRWSQLFFVGHTGERPRNLSPHFKQSTADVARACTMALRPYLVSLVEGGKRRIGLRVNLSTDMVGYIIGSQGKSLPEVLTNDLDNELVPAIHSAVNPSSDTPSSMEFVFNIVEMLS